jgi:uronate dehydrogenase
MSADVSDLDAMVRASQGISSVVHMAADPRVQAPWPDILNANIVGTYNAYEAAHRAGVRKLVFASSNHATGYYEKEGTYTTPEMPVRPDSYYGVSKVFGEAMGRYYADEHGLAAICLRIGSFQPQPRGERQLATWISHRDMAQLVWRAIEADVKFGVYYGISGNTRAYWDLSNARSELGYAPEDDAETYAAQVLAPKS